MVLGLEVTFGGIRKEPKDTSIRASQPAKSGPYLSLVQMRWAVGSLGEGSHQLNMRIMKQLWGWDKEIWEAKMGFLSHQGNGSLIVLCNGVVSCSVERQDFLPADGKSLFFVKIFIFHFSRKGKTEFLSGLERNSIEEKKNVWGFHYV